MSQTLASIEQMQQYLKDQQWEALNELITYDDALNDVRHEQCHFKLVAMFNLDHLRITEDFLRLLQARKNLSDNDPQYLYMLADTLMDRAQYAEAIPIIQDLSSIYQDNPYLYERLLVCAKSLNDDGLFVAALGKYRYSMAVQKMQELDFAEVANQLWESVQSEQYDARAPWLLGRALSYCGEYTEAENVWRKGWSDPEVDDSMRFDILQDRLQKVLGEGGSEEILFAIDQILELDKDDLEALRALAVVQERDGELLTALSVYQRLLDRYPWDISASLKTVYLANHLFEYHQSGMTLIDDESKLLVCRVLFHAGYESAALTLLEGIEQSASCFRQARVMMIEHLISNNEFDQALALLQPLLVDFAQDDELMALAAQSHCEKNDYQMAAELAGKAFEINVDNKRARFWWADSFYWQCNTGTPMSTGQLMDVISAYKEYADYNQTDGLPYIRVAEVYRIMKQYEPIQQYITLARDRGFLNPRVGYLMGLYYQSKQDYPAAIKEYNYAFEVNSGGVFLEALLARARCYFEAGELALAQEDLELLNERWPENEEVVALSNEFTGGGSILGKWLTSIKKGWRRD